MLAEDGEDGPRSGPQVFQRDSGVELEQGCRVLRVAITTVVISCPPAGSRGPSPRAECPPPSPRQSGLDQPNRAAAERRQQVGQSRTIKALAVRTMVRGLGTSC